jgi:hypothetical protein
MVFRPAGLGKTWLAINWKFRLTRKSAETLRDRASVIWRRNLDVAQTSQSAVSQVAKPANRRPCPAPPIWKSATQQLWKPALSPLQG